jgi:hypothetical protein
MRWMQARERKVGREQNISQSIVKGYVLSLYCHEIQKWWRPTMLH